MRFSFHETLARDTTTTATPLTNTLTTAKQMTTITTTPLATTTTTILTQTNANNNINGNINNHNTNKKWKQQHLLLRQRLNRQQHLQQRQRWNLSQTRSKHFFIWLEAITIDNLNLQWSHFCHFWKPTQKQSREEKRLNCCNFEIAPVWKC